MINSVLIILAFSTSGIFSPAAAITVDWPSLFGLFRAPESKNPILSVTLNTSLHTNLFLSSEVLYADSDTIDILFNERVRTSIKEGIPGISLTFPLYRGYVSIGRVEEYGFIFNASQEGKEEVENEELATFRGYLDEDVIPGVGSERIPVSMKLLGGTKVDGSFHSIINLHGELYYLVGSLKLRRNIMGRWGVLIEDLYGFTYGYARMNLDSAKISVNIEESQWNLDSLELMVVPSSKPEILSSFRGAMEGRDIGIMGGLEGKFKSTSITLDFLWKERAIYRGDYNYTLFYPSFGGDLRFDSLFIDSIAVDTIKKVIKGKGRLIVELNPRIRDKSSKLERKVGRSLGIGLSVKRNFFEVELLYISSRRISAKRSGLYGSVSLKHRRGDLDIKGGLSISFQKISDEEREAKVPIFKEFLRIQLNREVLFLKGLEAGFQVLNLPREIKFYDYGKEEGWSFEGFKILPSFYITMKRDL